jgi:hypothetical protein
MLALNFWQVILPFHTQEYHAKAGDVKTTRMFVSYHSRIYLLVQKRAVLTRRMFGQ